VFPAVLSTLVEHRREAVSSNSLETTARAPLQFSEATRIEGATGIMRIQTTTSLALFPLTLLFACGCASSPSEADSWLHESVRVEDALLLVEYVSDGSTKPVVVVDIDDTIVDGGTWKSIRLLLDPFYSNVAAYPGAADALSNLQADWNVILLTARDDLFRRRTVKWLSEHGFPRTPVIFSASFLLDADDRERYKTAAIAALQERGLLVKYGVGDKASDIGAYRRRGLEAILIVEGDDDPDLKTTRELLTRKYGAEAADVKTVHWNHSGWEQVYRHITDRG